MCWLKYFFRYLRSIVYHMEVTHWQSPKVLYSVSDLLRILYRENLQDQEMSKCKWNEECTLNITLHFQQTRHTIHSARLLTLSANAWGSTCVQSGWNHCQPRGCFSHLCSWGWCCSTVPGHWALSDTRSHWGLPAHSLRYIRNAPQLLQQSCFLCVCHAWALELSCTELHWFLGQLGEMKRKKKTNIVQHTVFFLPLSPWTAHFIFNIIQILTLFFTLIGQKVWLIFYNSISHSKAVSNSRKVILMHSL